MVLLSTRKYDNCYRICKEGRKEEQRSCRHPLHLRKVLHVFRKQQRGSWKLLTSCIQESWWGCVLGYPCHLLLQQWKLHWCIWEYHKGNHSQSLNEWNMVQPWNPLWKMQIAWRSTHCLFKGIGNWEWRCWCSEEDDCHQEPCLLTRATKDSFQSPNEVSQIRNSQFPPNPQKV